MNDIEQILDSDYELLDRIKEDKREQLNNDFGIRVLRILEIVFDGLHHCFQELSNIDVKDAERYVSIRTIQSFDTFDFNLLTKLVLAAHAFCVRVEINSCNMQYLNIAFTKRNGRDGRIYERHPSINEAIESFNKYYLRGTK